MLLISSEAAMSEALRWGLRPGEYLGEISALCFLHLPPHLSSLPLLLAGTGSQIQVYNLDTGRILRSFQVFEGVRVHGISLENFHKQLEGINLEFLVVVFGERRVKILNIKIESTGKKPIRDLELACVISLPMFGHWVLDVCFLKEDAAANEDEYYLAVGCSDNSVHLWNIREHKEHSQIQSSEKCLLYSMKMFGNVINSLFIASGTIFNEIVVWKVVSREQFTNLETGLEDSLRLTKHESLPLLPPIYENVLINRLVGHEGSIFRIAWFSSGKKLISVSDDRSARLWEVQGEVAETFCGGQHKVNQMTGSVLFGHNARIWDCCILDSLIITAGEDCTSRVWNLEGQELNEIKEHIGRGIWRCLCDPDSALLVTAGFDSAIRVHQLSRSLNESQEVLLPRRSCDQQEVFELSMPNYSRHGSLLDSKSEYVRCLHFANQDSLYVATNNGYLYHVSLVDIEDVIWTELGHVNKDGPIICMDLLSTSHSPSGGHEDWVALGNGKGNMKIIQAVGTSRCPEVQLTISWQAERERHLLGSFWCKSLQQRFVLTVNPSGRLKLWKLCYDSPSASQIDRSHDVILIGEFVSCFGMRIMCVDVSYDAEILVCGDIRGNLLLFSLPRDLLHCSRTIDNEAFPVCYFKGAHGVSTMRSVSIASLPSHQVQIRSTGTDGCICYLQHNKDLCNLEFVGMKEVKDLSAIQSVYESSSGTYAVGFASAYFMIWDITTTTKVLQITCGGWRRPNSYYVGETPEIMSCFSFVKDDAIYIHRNWLSQNELQLYPRNIHLQFHGREIHSLCFISGQSLFDTDNNQGLVSESCCISTASEDGTVRLSRYEPGMRKWLSSELLGVHVGGSAVRSMCYVSVVHTFFPDSMTLHPADYDDNKFSDTSLLVSVGAKRVVTAWKQINAICDEKVDSVGSKIQNGDSMNSSSVHAVSSFSFQWLSTDMPVMDSSDRNKQKTDESLEESSGTPFSSEGRNKEPELILVMNPDDNYRHLAVTAFLIKEAGLRFSVCFVVIASSDATVTLRALLLPHCLWFDIATLASSTSPVLTVQHVVVPQLCPKGNTQSGNFYLAIAGSTDGNILIWDLTASVETFMKHLCALPLESCSGVQKRPRTGRGSQGGRSWRSLDSYYAKTQTRPVQSNIRQQQENSGNALESLESCSDDHVGNQGTLDLLRSKHLVGEPTVVTPLHVFENAHQSGVNCLCVSDLKDASPSDLTFSFYIVSGGDDQSINSLRCDLKVGPARNPTPDSQSIASPQTVNNYNPLGHIKNSQLDLTCVDKITSAHSSAVKGIWTDGMFVFSVGLDQRLRCWSLDYFKLVERAHLIISVPEPEALDVKSNGRGNYQIAVAGRGIQMMEFSPTSGC